MKKKVKQAKKLEENQIWKLDVGCGDNKEQGEGWIGMDIEPFPCVDVVHNMEEFPWPFDDETFTLVSSSHVIEHLNPANKGMLKHMDEVWRILKYDGQYRISAPFAGSLGYWSDPTHINGVTPRTFAYFDPLHPLNLYRVYEPKPWKVLQCYWSPEGNIEILLSKRREDPSYSKFHKHRKNK